MNKRLILYRLLRVAGREVICAVGKHALEQIISGLGENAVGDASVGAPPADQADFKPAESGGVKKVVIKMLGNCALRCALSAMGMPTGLGPLLLVVGNLFAKQAGSHGELNVDEILDLF